MIDRKIRKTKMFSNHRSSIQTEMALNRMSVAWFHHTQGKAEPTPTSTPIITLPPRTSFRLSRQPKQRVEDLVDVIDIEDEDHSFAAFFIGMNTANAEMNVVKRPLVLLSCCCLL